MAIAASIYWVMFKWVQVRIKGKNLFNHIIRQLGRLCFRCITLQPVLYYEYIRNVIQANPIPQDLQVSSIRRPFSINSEEYVLAPVSTPIINR